MVPHAPPVNPVPLPAQMPPVKPALPPSHESDVSYALMTQTDIEVERDKRARYQEWKEDVTKEGGVNTAESQPGKAAGVGSAFWDSLSTFRTDTGTEATTIVQQRRMAREALLHPRPGIVGGPNSSSSSLPPTQASNMPAPLGSAAARPARSPPVPLLAHPPQSMLAPAPPSNAIVKPIPLAPGDPVYPAPSPKSTRAQRDAYLSSALDLPFDILRQRHVESPAASDTSSKPSNRRLASLLGMSKSKERLVSNHRSVSEAQIPRMDDSPRGSIGLGPNEPKRPLGRSVTVSPRLETATAKTDQSERTRKSPLVGPSQHAEVTKSKSANEAQSTRQMGSRTSQRSARPVQGDQGDQTSADPPRSLGSNRSQRKDPSSSRDQVEAPLRRYASNQHLTVPGVPEIPVEVPSLGSQASRRSKKTVKSRSRENLDGQISSTRGPINDVSGAKDHNTKVLTSCRSVIQASRRCSLHPRLGTPQQRKPGPYNAKDRTMNRLSRLRILKYWQLMSRPTIRKHLLPNTPTLNLPLLQYSANLDQRPSFADPDQRVSQILHLVPLHRRAMAALP